MIFLWKSRSRGRVVGEPKRAIGEGEKRTLIALPVTLAKARCRPSHENNEFDGRLLAWEGKFGNDIRQTCGKGTEGTRPTSHAVFQTALTELVKSR